MCNIFAIIVIIIILFVISSMIDYKYNKYEDYSDYTVAEAPFYADNFLSPFYSPYFYNWPTIFGFGQFGMHMPWTPNLNIEDDIPIRYKYVSPMSYAGLY